MGAACCCCVKHKTVMNGSPAETLHSRGRVAGEETSANWSRAQSYGIDWVEIKSSTTFETAIASEASSLFEPNSRTSRRPSSDQVISHNIVEVKESTGSPSVPDPTRRRLLHRSPGHHLVFQVSDSRILEYKSPSTWGNDSTRSSDSLSITALSELMSLQRERMSVDGETSGFGKEKITVLSARHSGSSTLEFQTCGICTKLLTDRSLWRSNSLKIMPTGEVAVVSVLTCGHVYHGECLERMTPELNKYDPACPVCTLGQKRVVKMVEKTRSRRRYSKRVIDSDLSSSDTFDQPNNCVEEKGLKMSSSSSMKTRSEGKPFLRRHFSFSSRTRKSISGNSSTSRKGFLWTGSSNN